MSDIPVGKQENSSAAELLRSADVLRDKVGGERFRDELVTTLYRRAEEIAAKLADLGCESVTAAATIDQAVALINGQAFDAAMLDLNLKGNSSYVVADAVAARGVPFVFCTGNSVHDMKDNHRDRAVLRKPFSEKALVEILTRLLAR